MCNRSRLRRNRPSPNYRTPASAIVRNNLPPRTDPAFPGSTFASPATVELFPKSSHARRFPKSFPQTVAALYERRICFCYTAPLAAVGNAQFFAILSALVPARLGLLVRLGLL